MELLRCDHRCGMPGAVDRYLAEAVPDAELPGGRPPGSSGCAAENDVERVRARPVRDDGVAGGELRKRRVAYESPQSTLADAREDVEVRQHVRPVAACWTLGVPQLDVHHSSPSRWANGWWNASSAWSAGTRKLNVSSVSA